ncbi:hypothetical protein R3P38DRAFT_2905004 [Favolaschia claudopus]|uniref:F-box domain-containing protein n=1 Tax=Favolaschia claudopus TaxID=2862362 RepID=A0AAW0CGL9_9AGAR
MDSNDAMSIRPAGPYLGHLSNQGTEYSSQQVLVQDADGRVRYTPFTRFVDTFPAELLAEIFLQLTELEDEEVALSTPQLWSCIDIQLYTARESEDYVDLKRRWLESARNTPLCVYLHDHSDFILPTGIPDPDASLVSLMQAIGRSSRQWEFIAIDVKDRLLMDALFSTVQNDFPLLKSLNLDSEVDPSLPGVVDSDADFPISFLNAPRLHQIMVFRYRSILVPWAQITWFWSSEIPLHSVYDILSRASRLVDASFEIGPGDGYVTDVRHTISCAHLKKLNVKAPSAWAFTVRNSPLAVLQHLNAPSLRKLTLGSHQSAEFGFNPLACDVSPFLHFLSQPSRGLQSLELLYQPVTSEDLVRCLKAIPSLARLVLLSSLLSDLNILFNQLTGDSDFLPRLVYVRIYRYSGTGTHSIDENGLARMLAWRWAAVGVAQLQCFHMPRYKYRSEIIDEKAWSTFQRLEEEGMGLCLSDV